MSDIDNNPFQKDNLFENNTKETPSLFGNSSTQINFGAFSGQGGLFGPTQSNTLFFNNNDTGGTLFGNTLTSTNNDNPFRANQGNNNSSLFGNNNDDSNNKEKNDENSRKNALFGTDESKFNFGQSFSLNNSSKLFGNNSTINPFATQKKDDEKKNENNKDSNQLFTSFLNNNNNGNTGFLFNTKNENENQSSQKKETNNINSNSTLFGITPGNNNNFSNIFKNNISNNDNKNENNIFGKKDAQFSFFNKNDNHYSLFSGQKEEEEKGDEKEEKQKEEKEEEQKEEKDNDNKNTSNNPFININNNSTFLNKKEEKPIKSSKESIFEMQNSPKKNNILESLNQNSQPKENVFEISTSKPKNNMFTEKNGQNNNQDLFLFNNEALKENNENKIIINNEIQNDSSLFNSNNKNSLFENLNKKQEINEIGQMNDMDVEEEVKEEASSSKSDIINNIWLSDNEEIIDDDTDVNKKIDYKNIEEKSKNIPNNINYLNLAIIPEISEYYFNLMKSSLNNINYDSNLENSIYLSNYILEVLHNQINQINDNDEKKSELINITTIYAYFDAFILHRNDVVYLMKLRDELFYKYFMPIETGINIDKMDKDFYNNARNKIDSIKNILKSIYLYLTMLDISKAKQKIIELNRMYKEFISKNVLGEKTLEFSDLFLNMEKIISIFYDIYNLKENFNSKQIISSFKMNSIFQDVKETIFELQKYLSFNEREENVKKIFNECQKICGMFAGDVKFIINEYNRDNIHLIILGNIFYRFYLNDFIRGLQNCLKENKHIDKDKNLINKYIFNIIKNCDSNQIEIVQELKGNYPFLLRYHMIEILSQNNFIYHIENQEQYLKKEAFLFFQMMRDSKISFKYYLNYFLFYPNYEIFTLDSGNDIQNLKEDISNELREEGYRKALDYALVYICYRFNNNDNIEELFDEINEIKKEINEKINNNFSNDIIYKINKLCLNKFIEQNIFNYSLIYYIDNYKLENQDFLKSQILEERKQLCAENDINFDYSKQFDKLIINFYLKTNYIFNINKFREVYESNEKQIQEEYKEYQQLLKLILSKKNHSPIDNSVQFMQNYIEFLLDVIKHNLNKIENNNENSADIEDITQKFFAKCYPLPKCPSFIWYHILMIIKNVIDENIYYFNSNSFLDNDNSCEQLFVWDKKLIYDLIKIEKMKNNNITFDEAQKMYENAVVFINDLLQGIYFNQNIFSSSYNNN